MNAKRVMLAGACLAGLAVSSPGVAAEITLPAEGWASWEVPAVEDARDMCCWNGRKPGDAARTACKLDDQRGNLGSRDDAKTDALRVYARVVNSKVERLRVLSATCPVESATPVRDLGTVGADDSARWLIALSRRGDSMNEQSRGNVVAALAMHPGDIAHDEIVSMARGGDRTESRKTAIFWLAASRGVPGATVVTELMFGDEDPDVRRHAAFAITESRSTRIAQDLIRLGNTDKDGEVRGQAWFWLAHTGAAESEDAIGAAVRKDADDNVREQAIFALSQLPGERGTRALIAVVEDRSASQEQRKRAIFWLAESEAAGAQGYLEKVLAGNVTR
jgi:hypothetical protein